MKQYFMDSLRFQQIQVIKILEFWFNFCQSKQYLEQKVY